MVEKVYYLEYNEETLKAIERIIDKFICFVKKKVVEMNYLEVKFVVRVEDVKGLENELRDVIWAGKLALR